MIQRNHHIIEMSQSNPSARPHARTVLIVDDDIVLLDALERAFREAGENAIACGTFEEARRVVRDQHLDALITDVRLGAFNGLQLAVMARDIQPNIQVIVFSGFDDPVLRADAERIGATYLVKPVPSAYLIQLLQSSGSGTP
jgi:two-component system response regulator YesN